MRSADPFLGRDILDGQFHILQKIGSGGMGAVYKANQPEMNRTVAVKILHPKLANRKDLVSRFGREARAMSHLSHPNTARVFLYGELDDGSLYIVMEFLEGRNLHQTVRKDGPMAWQRALPILVQVCGALEEAHQKGIVHRDLKPENIFLCNQGGIEDFPKVLDFGLAKVTEREMRPGSVILTQEGMVFGTPEFMSPEQAQGKILDARSDIYSVAIILFEALTGKLPFDAKSPMEYIQHHVASKPIDLNARVAGLTFPEELARVIAKAIEKRPEDRFQTAAELARALQAIGPESARVRDPIPSAQVNSPPAGPVAPMPGVATTMPTQVEPVVPQGRRPGLGLMLGVAAACLVLGVVLAIVVMKLMMR
jgi:serine/threonine-protein kinase